MKKLYCLFLLMIMLAGSLAVKAQSSWLFSTDYDMPNSLVNDITVDANHMVWVATEDGLCRYDGYRFTTYRTRPNDIHSLQENYVRRVFCDKAGHLIVGTRKGVQVYRPMSDDFTPLATFEDGSLTDGDVTGFVERRNGEIWMSGNSSCCLRFDANDKPVLYENPLTHRLDYTEDIIEDQQGCIWAIRRLQELYRLNPDGNIECIRRPDGTDIACNSLFCGADGNIYMGLNTLGLYRYNIQSGLVEQVGEEQPSCLVRDMFEMHDGRMLVATDNVGLKVFDFETQQLSDYEIRSEWLDPHTQKVHAVWEDQEYNLWLALYQRGVMVVPERSQAFHLVGSRSRQYNIIGDKCVTSLIIDHENVLWLTTDNGGMYAITTDGRLLKHFDCHVPNSTVPYALLRVFEDSKGRLWYGSFNQGFGWVDRKTGHFQPLQATGVRKGSADIYAFAEDSQHRVWAASMGTGLMLFDEATRTMSPAVHSDSCRWNNCLYYDAERNKMYVGSYNGLTIVDASDPERDPRQYLSDDIVFSVSQINSDTLCLCTGNGIVLFRLSDKQYERYSVNEGLLQGNYYSALTDTLGNVWLGSNVGLSCFNLHSHLATNYSVLDGLQSNEFSKNAILRDAGGNLWFGGSGGLSWFNPAEVSRASFGCEVRIIDMIVGGDYAMGLDEFDHDANTLVFSMGVLPLMKTRQAVYAYRLDNDPWTLLPMSTNTVSFSHLSSGNHHFTYKAILNGVESESKTFAFRIKYPWYYRWWAWLLWTTLAIGAMIVIGLSIRRRRAEKKSIEEQRRVQALSEERLNFFTNIAHEIRTPMTLIVGPLTKLMKSDDAPDRKRSYSMIMRNSNRILSLMNQLLDVRKIENNQMSLQCRELEIAPYTVDFCQSFADVAELRKIKLTLDVQMPQETVVWVDKQHYEKMLSNLISNALKFTPEGGSIDVSLHVAPSTDRYPEGRFILSVTDTGKGIADKDKPHVFNRFYQVKSNNSSLIGTGIGLYLTRELMDLHHGEVAATDNPAGQGTCLSLTFPLGRKHLSDADIDSSEETMTEDSVMAPDQIVKAIYSAPQPESAEISNRRRSHRTKTILVVEDENEVREYLVGELQPDFRVFSASNGVEALTELRKHMPDIIISDVMMPEMDGLTFVEKVRQNAMYNHVRIIILTAKAREDEKLHGIESGVDAYLTKPYSMDLLQATIYNLLGSQERARTAYNLQPVMADQIKAPEVANPDSQLLNKVVKIINQNLNNSSLTTEAIAQEVGMSRVHLFRKIKDLTGQSPSVYLRNIRLTKAAEILSVGDATMSDVAAAVGFDNQGAFSSAFKEMFGMSPTQYKQLQKAKKENETQTV